MAHSVKSFGHLGHMYSGLNHMKHTDQQCFA